MVSGRLTVSKEILGGVGKIRNRPQATIAVWNITNVCNLKCKHCYANSEARDEGELTTEEALRVVDELRELGVKILIFSGGEPLLREDIYDICGHAARKGLVVLVSSNGTTINDDDILQIKRAGIRYVGISIDGSRRTHDNFRGVTGSFDKAVEALKMLKAGNVRTGVRFTVVKYNLPDLPAIIKLLEKIGVPRLCVYHLVYSGRALNMAGEDLSPAERREDVADASLKRSAVASGLEHLGFTAIRGRRTRRVISVIRRWLPDEGLAIQREAPSHLLGNH
jgi:MoaA/NifB/PqqE/SkfB family radical SAM enzyme